MTMHKYRFCQRILSLALGFPVFLSTIFGQQVIPASDLTLEEQTYDFSRGSRLRLLAHQSVILNSSDRHLLVIDGGFVAFDLSKDIKTTNLQPVWQFQKPNDGKAKFQITNHGGLFISADQKKLWYHGGHFYNAGGWNESLYHVDKPDIPEWQLWELDLTNHLQKPNGWLDVTDEVVAHEKVNRTFASASTSVPRIRKSFWIGGASTPRTSRTTPIDRFEATSQMLVFDETTREISSSTYPGSRPGSRDYGYYHGKLLHLPIGSGAGYLLSLMSLAAPAYESWVDPDGDGGNREDIVPPVTNVSWKTIPLYDLEKERWITQETLYFEDELPEPRTRFCAALFHNEMNNTWDVWVHGGQRPTENETATTAIYVLSMPSFIWKRMEPLFPELNEIRSHTCHAVGDQLLIVGGYPAGQTVLRDTYIDDQYIKVLKIGDTLNWADTYQPGTTYQTPDDVQRAARGQEPFYPWADDRLREAFAYEQQATISSNTSTQTTSTTDTASSSKTATSVEPSILSDLTESSFSPAAIAGCVVGGVLGLLAVLLALWGLRKHRRAKRAHYAAKMKGNDPRSPLYGQPEAIKDGSLQPSAAVVQTGESPAQDMPGGGSGQREHELEGSTPDEHVGMRQRSI
ncbi:uncharacterized protein A1O9_08582 [Exophiala aquamarina CBS 119918]|uniref:Kelch repeat protein n=1 Tax=Exophiala aquamarina CBS 119918 TaxID=1182545 RepID=A0A072P7M6_9EURO|nr:uncharacterized protein A1O9_08582 [Exophiala aquamarina CBS 119918]KEF55831.1 hypothetical protein A1O9_08582 [Exophiala aquamarina CBS 119918]